MKGQFVHQASAQDAAQQSDELLQLKELTIEYYNSLMFQVNHMVEIPWKYDLCIWTTS
jgi:hypothetical protein